MKKSLALLLSLGLLVFGLTGCGSKDDQKQDDPQQDGVASSYVWGSASLGSNGYVIIEAFVSTVNKAGVDFKNSSVATGGGAENMALLDANEIQFGQAMSSDMENATKGITPYDKKIEFNQILGYTYSDLPIMVFDDSSYQKPEDLKGAKIAVGPANGAAAYVAQILFSEIGIIDDVTFVYGSWQECADALKVGQADASFNFHTNGRHVISAYEELYQTKPMRPISVDKALLEKIASENEGLVVSVIHDGAYPTYVGDHDCISTTSVLVCRPEIPDDVVYTITKTILENAEAEIAMAPTNLEGFGNEMAIDAMIDGYPIHPGAAKYFKEVGLWRDGMVEAAR